jgi:hypothetical protein
MLGAGSEAIGNGSEGKKGCNACSTCGFVDTDPTKNGCLCFDIDYTEQVAFFLPTDENGECIGGSQPVLTNYMEIYEIIATWNVDGTRIGVSSSTTDEDNEIGEGNDELINSSCLCISNTGCVVPAAFDPRKYKNYKSKQQNNFCKNEADLPVFNA